MGLRAESAQPVGRCREHRVGRHRRLQALRHLRGAVVGARVVAQPAVEQLFGEQKRRGDFDREGVRQRTVGTRGTLPGREPGVGEHRDAGASERVGHFADLPERANEFGALGGAAAGDRLPGFLRQRDAFASARQRAGVELTVARPLEVGRHRTAKRERIEDRRERRRHFARPREGEQHVAQQTIRDRRALVERAPQLQVQARQQALGVDVELGSTDTDRLEQAREHVPERRVRRADRGVADPRDRRPELAERVAGVPATQQLQQREFELRAHRLARLQVELDNAIAGDLQTGLGREEEVRRMNPIGAPRLEQIAVVGEQVQRLRPCASQNVVEVLADRREGA